MRDVRKAPRPQYGWGLYNWGSLRGTHYRRKDAIAEAERECGEPWSVCRRYMEVHKVAVYHVPKSKTVQEEK